MKINIKTSSKWKFDEDQTPCSYFWFRIETSIATEERTGQLMHPSRSEAEMEIATICNALALLSRMQPKPTEIEIETTSIGAIERINKGDLDNYTQHFLKMRTFFNVKTTIKLWKGKNFTLPTQKKAG